MKKMFSTRCIGWLLAALLAAPVANAMPPGQTAPTDRRQNSSNSAQSSEGRGLETRPPADSQSNPPAGAQGNQPLGTAAAPYEKTEGITASRPAGAVIAPAKQRRRRSILIKIGIVVGTGAAIAAVAALSHSSPSRPQ